MTDPTPRPPGPITRVATWPLEGLVLAYRTLISPLLGPSCRYYPSCSTYALTALRRFGPLVGTWLAVRRLLRCHPWCAGGVDHVPPRGARGLPDWAAYRADAVRREAQWDTHPADDVPPGDVRPGDACPAGLIGGAAPRDRVRDDDSGHPDRDPTQQRRGMR